MILSHILFQILGAIVEALPIISNDNPLPIRLSRSTSKKVNRSMDNNSNLIS